MEVCLLDLGKYKSGWYLVLWPEVEEVTERRINRA